MEVIECITTVVDRIKILEPEYAEKIVGYILVLDDGQNAMRYLATSEDFVIQDVTNELKAKLVGPNLTRLADTITQPCSYPNGFHGQGSDPGHLGWMDELQNEAGWLSLGDETNPVNVGYRSDSLSMDNDTDFVSGRNRRQFYRTDDAAVKICRFFVKGYCKHGNECVYRHVEGLDRLPRVYNDVNNDVVHWNGPLETLELEIVEILRSTNGEPVSIDSLQIMYLDKYGKLLQVEGRAGLSSIILVAILKNRIRIIERPNGQHAIVLAEDAPKYWENPRQNTDLSPMVSESRQIYLTFPPDSTFTENDISNYFRTFGAVEDVRIPNQQRRMFGFVTFGSAETVRRVLQKGNPHYVYDSRILVKPYREKPKLVDRKYQDRFDSILYSSLESQEFHRTRIDQHHLPLNDHQFNDSEGQPQITRSHPSESLRSSGWLCRGNGRTL